MGSRRSRRLVGREEHLAALRSIAVAAGAGSTQVVLIEGDPGIGKTRLAQELLAELRSQGDLVLVGHGIDLAGGELGYGLASELLRALVGRFDPREVASMLGAQVGVLASLEPRLVVGTAGASVDRSALFAAFQGLVSALARDRCCVSPSMISSGWTCRRWICSPT